jgi:hypothetical protein
MVGSRNNAEASELVVAGALEMVGGVEEVLMELRRRQKTVGLPLEIYFILVLLNQTCTLTIY